MQNIGWVLEKIHHSNIKLKAPNSQSEHINSEARTALSAIKHFNKHRATLVETETEECKYRF